jgi:hypothetical protein
MPLDHGRPRMLSEDEIVDLRREMQEASAWMRAELLRRRCLARVVSQPESPQARKSQDDRRQD